MKRIPVLTILTDRWHRMVLACPDLFRTLSRKRSRRVFGAGALTVSLAFAFAPSAAEGAVPRLINFQGILKDGSGNPVADASYSVTFTIYDAATGGNNLWMETQSVTTTDGLFAILLGSSNPVPDTAFKGANRWLGVAVAPDGEMPARQQLVSVGYAYRVNSVDSASGGTISGDLTLSGGNLNLDNSSPTGGNIFKGGALFIHDFGVNNTFIGRNAGKLTMSGEFTTAIGANALSRNTTGVRNTASGASALQNNTIGFLNTASGAGALEFNTEGSFNTASGEWALRNNTGGNYNTASGVEALFKNTDGNYNTASGVYALFNNTIGSSNTASGANALASNTTGSYNTASGARALQDNTTGNNNTASGRDALINNTTGSFNTVSGVYALFNNSTGSSNTASGASALQGNTTGNENTACGVGSLTINYTGSNNTAIGANADVAAGDLNNATAIGNGATATASNMIRLGNAAVTVIEGQVAFTFTSDKNQKENFRPVDGGEVLRKIRGFNLASWNYKGHDPQQFRHYGPMAQDFFAAFGDDGIGKIGTETTLNSGDVAGILMVAVQALEKEKELIKTENQDLRKEIKDLRELVRKLLAKEEGKSTQTYTLNTGQKGGVK